MTARLSPVQLLTALALALVWPAFQADRAHAVECGSSGTLTVYTSQREQHAQETAERFEDVCPGISVQWVRNNAVELTVAIASVESERDDAPDVVMVSDALHMAELKAAGRLLPYPGALTGPYDPRLHDPDKTFFATKLMVSAIVRNARASRTPERWADLVRSELRTELALSDPRRSATALNDLHALVQSDSHGWHLIEQLARQDALLVGGQVAVLRAVASGQANLGVVRADLALAAQDAGWQIEVGFPEDGTPAMTEPVGILTTAKNVQAAKAFIDFLLSDKGQKLVARQGFVPAHPGIAAPRGYPRRDRIRVLPFDADKAIRTDRETRSRFQGLFFG